MSSVEKNSNAKGEKMGGPWKRKLFIFSGWIEEKEEEESLG